MNNGPNGFLGNQGDLPTESKLLCRICHRFMIILEYRYFSDVLIQPKLWYCISCQEFHTDGTFELDIQKWQYFLNVMNEGTIGMWGK